MMSGTIVVEKMLAPAQVPFVQREGQRVAGELIQVLVVGLQCPHALERVYDFGADLAQMRLGPFTCLERDRSEWIYDQGSLADSVAYSVARA
jgi:hypothetical protein